METKLCSFCHKRRVRQQEWKTDAEKEMCLTCECFMKQLNLLAEIMTKELNGKVGVSGQIQFNILTTSTNVYEQQKL